MKSEKFVGLVLAAVVFAACQSDTYYMKGEAHGFADGTELYLAEAVGERHVVDTLAVQNERFAYSAPADGRLLCLIPAGAAEPSLHFFACPGNVYVELSTEVGRSRVSGTKVNNEWQALCDTVAKYNHEIRSLFETDSLHPRKIHAGTERLYTTLTRRITETALRNKDNALGRFISSHYLPK